jgi:hypothetical protein
MEIAAFLTIFIAHFFLIHDDLLFDISHEWEYVAETSTSSFEGRTGPSFLTKAGAESSNPIFDKFLIRYENKFMTKDTTFFILKLSRFQGEKNELSISYSNTAKESEIDTFYYFQTDNNAFLINKKGETIYKSTLYVIESKPLVSNGVIYQANNTSHNAFTTRYVHKIGILNGYNKKEIITGGSTGHYWGKRISTNFSLSKFDNQMYIFTETATINRLKGNFGDLYTSNLLKSNITYDILGRTDFGNYTSKFVIQDRQKKIVLNKCGQGNR